MTPTDRKRTLFFFSHPHHDLLSGVSVVSDSYYPAFTFSFSFFPIFVHCSSGEPSEAPLSLFSWDKKTDNRYPLLRLRLLFFQGDRVRVWGGGFSGAMCCRC